MEPTEALAAVKRPSAAVLVCVFSLNRRSVAEPLKFISQSSSDEISLGCGQRERGSSPPRPSEKLIN